MLFYTKVDSNTELLVNGIRKLSLSKLKKNNQNQNNLGGIKYYLLFIII